MLRNFASVLCQDYGSSVCVCVCVKWWVCANIYPFEISIWLIWLICYVLSSVVTNAVQHEIYRKCFELDSNASVCHLFYAYFFFRSNNVFILMMSKVKRLYFTQIQIQPIIDTISLQTNTNSEILNVKWSWMHISATRSLSHRRNKQTKNIVFNWIYVLMLAPKWDNERA